MYCSLSQKRDPRRTRNPRSLSQDFHQVFEVDTYSDTSRRSHERNKPPAPGSLHCSGPGLLAFETRAISTTIPRPQKAVVGDPSSNDRIETGNYLECAAIALAAQVITKQQIAIARHLNGQLRQCDQPSDRELAHGLAQRFHLCLVNACPNAYMVTLFHNQSFNKPEPGTELAMTPDEIIRAADDHDEILRMIDSQASRKSIERFLSRHISESTGCCAIA